jgi:endonuclease/exonuclease/phosphatase family metal-dependent hydrolase
MLFRRYFLIVVLFLPIIPAIGQSLKILTYNIRYDNPGDGPNAWPMRKAWLCEQIKTVSPGIFGIQEGLMNQVKYIDSTFSGFRHIGVGRDDGKVKGEFCAIWYDTKKIRLVRNGNFWLSATPEKPSMGWDAACMRLCTYGLFRDIQSGKKFWVFNTHFDHVGVQARKNSALLILQRIAALNKSGFPVILMGDFNGDPESEPIKIISGEMKDAKSADKSMAMGPDGTFNGFDAKKPVIQRIDFIFTGYGANPMNYFVIREMRDGRYASDHFPVAAEVNF